jgi:hypothetical protein
MDLQPELTRHARAVDRFAGLTIAALIGLAALPAPGAAQATSAAPQRSSTLVVYGNDPCPKGTGGEIIVCARRPESERYRIPKNFRGRKAAESPASNSWANKAEANEQASRTAAGLPDTCSAVGSGGQTGCYHQFLMQARAQRQADKEEAAQVP